MINITTDLCISLPITGSGRVEVMRHSMHQLNAVVRSKIFIITITAKLDCRDWKCKFSYIRRSWLSLLSLASMGGGTLGIADLDMVRYPAV